MKTYDEWKINGVTKMAKKIAIYKVEGDDVYINTGKEDFKITLKELNKELDNNYNSKYKYIKCEKRLKVNGIFKDCSLNEYYKYFTKCADELKKATKGEINLYKTGKPTTTALFLFYKFLDKEKHIPDPIKLNEAMWLDDANFGALTYAKQYKGPAYKADVISMYPSFMSSTNMYYPIREGKFKIVDSFKNPSAQAIYRCIIYKSGDINKDMLFRFNIKNKYPIMDILTAQKLGLQCELIQDGDPNVLLYERNDCITGSQLFGKFIKYMFDLKTKKIEGSKIILNSLWGKLGNKRVIKMVVDINDEFDLKDDKEIIKIDEFNDRIEYTLCPINGFYASDFARICPFLVSRGRYIMANMLKDYTDKIIYLHTDGVQSTEKLPIKYGNDLGDMKYEGHASDCEIINITNKKGEFKL